MSAAHRSSRAVSPQTLVSTSSLPTHPSSPALPSSARRRATSSRTHGGMKRSSCRSAKGVEGVGEYCASAAEVKLCGNVGQKSGGGSSESEKSKAGRTRACAAGQARQSRSFRCVAAAFQFQAGSLGQKNDAPEVPAVLLEHGESCVGNDGRMAGVLLAPFLANQEADRFSRDVGEWPQCCKKTDVEEGAGGQLERAVTFSDSKASRAEPHRLLQPFR